jgi:hypothetical protein
MIVFGKHVRDYLYFARHFLIATMLVGTLRLLLSLAGVPTNIVNLFSINIVGLAAMIAFAIRVHTTGFGGYRQLLILIALEILSGELVIATGILLTAVTGISNIFSEPEFSNSMGHMAHAVSHLILGPTLFAVMAWVPASAILFVTRRIAPRKA